MKVSRSVARALCHFHAKAPLMLPKHEKQQLARQVRDNHGLEMTPDDAEGHLRDALATIRQRMVDRGYLEFATMSDAELRRMEHEAMG